MARRHHPDHRRPSPQRGAHHVGPPGSYPRGGATQSPKWVVFIFSPADAHIAICDPQRLPGPQARMRVADCARVIVKALWEGNHHALPPRARLKDHANPAKPEVWLQAALPAHLQLQLTVPTTVYHWLQACHDLRWRGKPDRRIGVTHWQEWLLADAQHAAIRGMRPGPAARALDASRPGRTLAPYTVLLANLPFNPAPESSVRMLVPLPPARGATKPSECLSCADRFYTSGAMMEQLAWHKVHAAAPAEDREAASHILQGRAGRSLWHAPYAQPFPLRGLATRRPPERERLRLMFPEGRSHR